MSATLDLMQPSLAGQYAKALSAGALRVAFSAALSALVSFIILAVQVGGMLPAFAITRAWVAILHAHLAVRGILFNDRMVLSTVAACVFCVMVLAPVLAFQFTRWRRPGLGSSAILPDQRRTLVLHLEGDKIFAVLQQILQEDSTLYDLKAWEDVGRLTARSMPFARYRDTASRAPGYATADAGAARNAGQSLRRRLTRLIDLPFIGGPRRVISIEVTPGLPAQTEVTIRSQFRTLLPALDSCAQNRRTVEAIADTLKSRVPRLIAEQRALAERAQLDRRLLDARLQVLRAQIEPHFLYNTLANVQYLIRNDAPAADAMVGELITYLRQSLPKMRNAESTIGGEIALARAYLNVLRIRMGGRLSIRVAMPPELESLAFPPMMLMSLVENAIKHGLEPKSGPGLISITVNARADMLHVEVGDDGVGFGASAGSGIGLKNVRETLASMFADRARLIVEPNDGPGVTAAIDLPLVRSDAVVAAPHVP